MSDKYGRFHYLNAVLTRFPGQVGVHLRRIFITKYFNHAGNQITIHEGVRFRGIHNLNVGNNVHIGVDNFLQASGGIEIQDGVMLGPGVKIWSVNHVYDDISRPILEQGYIEAKVTIGKGSWIAANVFIMPGVIIPEGCVVSAGSVVNIKNYPPYSILSGNPCRVIGRRGEQI